MSYKNLRSPKTNTNEMEAEKVAPIPVKDDPRKNGDTVNNTQDRAEMIPWGPAKTLPEGRPPMKLKD